MAVEFHHTDIEKISEHVANWADLPDKVLKEFSKCSEFSVSFDGEELLVYTTGSLHAICTVAETFKGKVTVSDCTVMGGKKVWEI